MPSLTSQYRLRSSAFVRTEENNKVDPKRIVFLSVEGARTEKDYFTHLNASLDSSLIHIEVLQHRRGDGYVAPTYVVELLQEYLSVRQGELIPPDVINVVTKRYSKDTIQAYLEQPETLKKAERAAIQRDLMMCGIDIEYRRYLQKYDTDTDIFGVVLDRDSGSHTREDMEAIIKYCHEKEYGCYVSNPCFEFWLLLHLCDVMVEYTEEEKALLHSNSVISATHTYTSNEVSKRAHHSKHISAKIFHQKYFPFIETAVERSEAFATKFPELLDQLGTNIPDLLKVIGFLPL